MLVISSIVYFVCFFHIIIRVIINWLKKGALFLYVRQALQLGWAKLDQERYEAETGERIAELERDLERLREEQRRKEKESGEGGKVVVDGGDGKGGKGGKPRKWFGIW